MSDKVKNVTTKSKEDPNLEKKPGIKPTVEEKESALQKALKALKRFKERTFGRKPNVEMSDK